MKKLFLYSLMLSSVLSFSSCSDEDESFGASLDREWMTMFICDNNRGKGDDYAYNCKAEGPNGNDIHLYWYGVNDCAGYQIRQALQPNVANGADAWGTSAENGLLLLDTPVVLTYSIWLSKTSSTLPISVLPFVYCRRKMTI